MPQTKVLKIELGQYNLVAPEIEARNRDWSWKFGTEIGHQSNYLWILSYDLFILFYTFFIRFKYKFC